MNVTFDLSAIKNQLQACHSKENTFKTLVALSKVLPRLSSEEKTDEHKIKGCESAVWLIVQEQDGLKYFQGDSDAKLMRGALAAIICLVDGKSAQAIQALDLHAELSELNLASYLTSSRTNGIHAILTYIKELTL